MNEVIRDIRPKWLALVVLPFLAGCMVMFVAAAWWQTTKPFPVQVVSITVTKSTNATWGIEVASVGPPATDCIRLTQHVIYRDRLPPSDSKPTRDYIPLGMALNGSAFGSVPDFNVLLEAPANTPRGKWNYVNRSAYFCSIFPGLSKQSEAISMVHTIDLE